MTAINRIVRQQAEHLRIPGGAFGLIVNGEVVHKIAEGPRALSKKATINSQTQFQTGSIAKSFAATVAVKFHAAHKLHLDDPIQKHLTDRCKNKLCEGITIRHLLSHSSGIPSVGLNNAIESGVSYNVIVSEALKAKKTCAPGKCFQYNNVAFELVREILEKVDGNSYYKILKREILDPLEMTDTTATYAELKQSENYFTPHMYLNGRFKETDHSTAYYAFPGSSVLNTDLDDMLKFVSAELGNSPKVMSPEVLKILHEPSTEAPDAYAWFDKSPDQKKLVSQYGLGHRLLKYAGQTIVFHSGWLKGCKNVIAMFPEKKIGIVLLQNSDAQVGFRIMEDIARYLQTQEVRK